MVDTCEIHFKLSKADFSSLGLGDKHFRIEADLGQVVEIYHPECARRGEELREQLDANSVAYLGSHGSGADYGWGTFASDGERSLDAETDCDGTYLVRVSRNGIRDENDLALVGEFMTLRNLVAEKLGLCR